MLICFDNEEQPLCRFKEEKIRYVVTDATDGASLLRDFFDEAEVLLQVPESDVSTTFLVAPEYKEGIEAFYQVYEWLDDELEGARPSETEDENSEDVDALVEAAEDPPSLEEFVGNRIQPAFFHPDWTFAELPEESALHFEKRAPFPVINLLRRAQLDRVVSEGLERGVIVNKMIADHNAAALEHEGFSQLEALFEGLKRTSR